MNATAASNQRINRNSPTLSPARGRVVDGGMQQRAVSRGTDNVRLLYAEVGARRCVAVVVRHVGNLTCAAHVVDQHVDEAVRRRQRLFDRAAVVAASVVAVVKHRPAGVEEQHAARREQADIQAGNGGRFRSHLADAEERGEQPGRRLADSDAQGVAAGAAAARARAGKVAIDANPRRRVAQRVLAKELHGHFHAVEPVLIPVLRRPIERIRDRCGVIVQQVLQPRQRREVRRLLNAATLAQPETEIDHDSGDHEDHRERADEQKERLAALAPAPQTALALLATRHYAHTVGIPSTGCSTRARALGSISTLATDVSKIAVKPVTKSWR